MSRGYASLGLLEKTASFLWCKIGGRASGSALPGRAGERVETGSPALPGNQYLEALPRLDYLEKEPRFLGKIGGRASGSALPGRAWERVDQ